MNILFVGPHLRYNVMTPEREPLGGSESCLCYAARALAERGHAVTVLLSLPLATPEMLAGVRHAPKVQGNNKAFFDAGAFDAIVTLNAPDSASRFRDMSPNSVHVSWMQMMPGQLTASELPVADCSIYVSRTQRDIFPPGPPAYVIGNGIAPAFENMFGSVGELRAAKRNRGAYTSTPFRGLGMLIAIMERTKADIEVDVYSSMRVYQGVEDNYVAMYQHIQRTPRMYLRGSLPQPVLAERLRQTGFLCYPCGFAETYCIAASEAIAAGLEVISTDLGALKETTLGYAALLPFDEKTTQAIDYINGYCALLEKHVAAYKNEPQAWAEKRFAQSQEINRRCSWKARAKEWEDTLAAAVATKRS